jgi:hypothetical protein
MNGVVYMRKYNCNVQSREDIIKEFPEYEKIPFTTENLIKILKLTGERETIYKKVEREGMQQAEKAYGKKLGELTKEDIKKVAALGHIKTAYRVIWCRDNIENQLFCAHDWGEMKNRKILFGRMERMGLPALCETETIYEFIGMVEGGGYIEKTVNGRTFTCFDAKAPIEEKYKQRAEEWIRLSDR